MPVIDFQNPDQFDAAVEFLLRRGVPFDVRPPECLVVRGIDYKALEKAKILPSSPAKANGARGKKTRSSSKPKAGGAH